ncbi:MAG: pentapeptide repeat-containing protein [Allorhizobium sp.]
MPSPVSRLTPSQRSVGLLFAVALGLGGWLGVPSATRASGDCRDYAGSGIDWSQCDKRMLMLGGSVLDNAMLEKTDFSFTDLRKVSAKSANFEKAKLLRTTLAGSQLDGANFTRAEAYRSDFSGVSAEGVSFYGAEMQRAIFVGAELAKTDFSKAELGRADFRKATLTGSRFSMANLSRARLNGAVFEGAIDFQNVFLLFARIEGVDLTLATGLTQTQVDLACGDAKTRLPPGLTMPTTWPCADDPQD